MERPLVARSGHRIKAGSWYCPRTVKGAIYRAARRQLGFSLYSEPGAIIAASLVRTRSYAVLEFSHFGDVYNLLASGRKGEVARDG
jgi:hypothetical protein